MLKTVIKALMKNVFFWQQKKDIVYVFINASQIGNYPDYEERSRFYLNGSFKVIIYKNTVDLIRCLALYGPYRVIFTPSGISKLVLNNYFLDVDYKSNPSDGWAWHEAINLIHPSSESEIAESKQRLVRYYNSLSKHEYSLVMGTGPSLVKARKLTNLDCYKIACNTIVKDHKLWLDLKPHFIVAGDAIYHFAHNLHAASFRRDLKKCLRDYEVPFLYPALYHPFVKEEFREFSHLLIPIPTDNSDRLNNDLLNNFHLPSLGNVLNLLLLPLATSITKKIYLLGFDGRKPSDKLFWTNSSDHSYTEFIPDIQKKHPMFFDYFIDDKNPFKYVNAVHGDALDNNLNALESIGYEFVVLAPSHTNTMQKRFKPVFDLD